MQVQRTWHPRTRGHRDGVARRSQGCCTDRIRTSVYRSGGALTAVAVARLPAAPVLFSNTNVEQTIVERSRVRDVGSASGAETTCEPVPRVICTCAIEGAAGRSRVAPAVRCRKFRRASFIVMTHKILSAALKYGRGSISTSFCLHLLAVPGRLVRRLQSRSFPVLN
jgi:hypothetical protein